MFVQVGPALLVLGEEARENGLKYSLLERLLKLYKSQNLADFAKYHMFDLNVNYRCHANIMNIPNKLFYSSKIIPMPVDALSHPRAPFPLIFVCSSLSHEAEPWLEARVLLDILEDMVIRSWPSSWGPTNLHDVALIAASRTQVLDLKILVIGRFIIIIVVVDVVTGVVVPAGVVVAGVIIVVVANSLYVSDV